MTVIFVPVGFATGIFSMSSAPPRETLISMIITAIVALLATIIALINAKFLDAKIVGPILYKSREITYSTFEILFDPCIYFYGRYIYFPLFYLPKQPNLKPNLSQQNTVGELFDRKKEISSWEKARENYRTKKNVLKMEKDKQKEGEEIKEVKREIIDEHPRNTAERIRVLLRRGKKTTETNPVP